MGSGASNMFSQNPMKKNFPIEDVPSFKIVLVGDSNVGKSSIFLRFTHEQFDYSYQPTMNANIGNVTKKVQFPFETLVSITLWDLPGREEIDLRRSYYKDIDAAIVVVDLTDKGSIDMAGTWKQDITNNSMFTGQSNMDSEKMRKKSMKSQLQIPILLVGNKFDKISQNEDNESIEPSQEIQTLEEVASQNGFVGCVAVSARDSDGGVHAAIRSLVRYLLQKKMPKKVKNQTNESSNMRDVFTDPSFARNLASVDDHNYIALKSCRIPEFDNIFKECDKQIKQVETCCVGFLISVKNFKRACCVSGVTDTYKSSIGECITGLKDSLRDGDNEVLIAIEETCFIKLAINDEERKIPGPIKRVLDVYENEVCKRTKRVLTLCPTLKINIADHLNTLTQIESQAEQKAIESNINKKDIKRTIQIIKANMNRLSETIDLANESMRVTDDQYKKIKNAMMW